MPAPIATDPTPTAEIPSISELRAWLNAQAAQIAPQLPELTDLRVSVGNYMSPVSVNGYCLKVRRHVFFDGDTIEQAVANARRALPTLK